MQRGGQVIKINLAELNTLADAVIRHAEVILVQRDPKDKKMDERSAILHKLWLRISEKTQNRAGAYPNIKDHPTHEQVLTIKLKELLDKVIDAPLNDEDYTAFLASLLQKALNASF